MLSNRWIVNVALIVLIAVLFFIAMNFEQQPSQAQAARISGLALDDIDSIEVDSGESVTGFEMHMGRTNGPDTARPMFKFGDGRTDGAVSADGRVRGGYLHGLFASGGFRHACLNRIRARAASGLDYEAEIDRVLDRLADHLAAHLDLDRILEIARAR